MDKRKCGRKPVHGAISGRLILADPLDIIDLSASGIRFYCSKKVDPNSLQKVKIAKNDVSLILKGQVVRSTLKKPSRLPGERRLLYEVALHFGKLSEKEERSIEELIRLLGHGKADRTLAR